MTLFGFIRSSGTYLKSLPEEVGRRVDSKDDEGAVTPEYDIVIVGGGMLL